MVRAYWRSARKLARQKPKSYSLLKASCVAAVAQWEYFAVVTVKHVSGNVPRATHCAYSPMRNPAVSEPTNALYSPGVSSQPSLSTLKIER